jgi:ferredoxin
MKVDAGVCIRCGACASVCPVNAIEVADARVRADKNCTNCGICSKICPVGAIEVERRRV